MKNSELFAKLLTDAASGRPVWIQEAHESFLQADEQREVYITLVCADGVCREWFCPLPKWQSEEEQSFLHYCFCARIYNILSVFSGSRLCVYADTNDEKLCSLIRGCFLEFERIPGYKKLLNIAGRICSSFGLSPFEFELVDITKHISQSAHSARSASDITAGLETAIQRTQHGAYCGIDVGGTDIKLALSLDGRLLAVKEYDWNPTDFTLSEQYIEPVVLLCRLMRACVIAQTAADEKLDELISAALEPHASVDIIVKAVSHAEALCSCPPLFEGIGLSFPDIIISNRILGGETPKTLGIRNNPAVDYEDEFRKLGELIPDLSAMCREGCGCMSMNDGFMTAFSAALELYAAGHSEEIADGIIALAIGTDLGAGWLLPDGSIAPLPLEFYDILLDMGAGRGNDYPPEDLRSVRNENSGLVDVRRYFGQAAAFRRAWEIEPKLLDGYTDFRDGILSIKSSPEDLRKPCLQSLLSAADKDVNASRLFREYGADLGQLDRELQFLIRPETDKRYVFGRFFKEEGSFRMIAEGFSRTCPDVTLIRADEELAASGLMRQLCDCPNVSISQFAQAIGSIYYAAMQ